MVEVSHRPGGLGVALFQRRVARRVLHAGRMVCHAPEAIVESARLDFWSGVVGALHADGGDGVAGVEARRFRRATAD
jgi:hypothetical protein